MRADRLIATLLVLQARGRVTAADLADELEVSVATARRDLEALSASGVPVYPERGRKGGWQLVGGARTDLSGLTAGEAQALFSLVGPGRRHPEVRAALRKLLRALPATLRDEASAASDAVVVDPAGWGESGPGRPGDAAPRWHEDLRSAIVRRRRVAVTYLSRHGGETTRTVDPWALVDKDGVWYLVAGTPDGRRTFRLDRIANLTVTESPAERPPRLDVEDLWHEVVTSVEDRREAVVVTLVARPGALAMLRLRFGRSLQVGETDRDGVHATVAGPSADWTARLLASFADGVEVRSPESVKERLGEIGSYLHSRYGALTPAGATSPLVADGVPNDG